MEKLYEKICVAGVIPPQSVTTNASTDVIDMQKYEKVLFIVSTGVMGTAGKVDFNVFGDALTGGGYATPIVGKAINQLTKVGGQDNKEILVEVDAVEVATQGLRFIKGTLVATTAASLVGVVAVAMPSQYSPAKFVAAASQGQILD